MRSVPGTRTTRKPTHAVRGPGPGSRSATGVLYQPHVFLSAPLSTYGTARHEPAGGPAHGATPGDDALPPAARHEVVYLACPMRLYADPAYDATLAALAARYPDATVLSSRGLWPSTAEWLATWRDVLAPVTLMVILPDSDGLIGRGVVAEFDLLQRRGVPIMAILPDGEVESIHELFIVDPDDWSHYASVHEPECFEDDYLWLAPPDSAFWREEWPDLEVPHGVA